MVLFPLAVCILLLVALIGVANAHYYGNCVHTTDPSRNSFCTEDPIYISVRTNHGGLSGTCFNRRLQARVRVKRASGASSGAIVYDVRPIGTGPNSADATTGYTIGPNLNDYATTSNPNICTGVDAPSMTICKQPSTSPPQTSCSSGSGNYFRYGPVNLAPAFKTEPGTFSYEIWGYGCDSYSVRATSVP